MRRLSALLAWLVVSTTPAVAFARPVAPFAADAGVNTHTPSESHHNLTFTAESLRVRPSVDSHHGPDPLDVRREWYLRCHDRATRAAPLAGILPVPRVRAPLVPRVPLGFTLGAVPRDVEDPAGSRQLDCALYDASADHPVLVSRAALNVARLVDERERFATLHFEPATGPCITIVVSCDACASASTERRTARTTSAQTNPASARRPSTDDNTTNDDHDVTSTTVHVTSTPVRVTTTRASPVHLSAGRGASNDSDADRGEGRFPRRAAFFAAAAVAAAQAVIVTVACAFRRIDGSGASPPSSSAPSSSAPSSSAPSSAPVSAPSTAPSIGPSTAPSIGPSIGPASAPGVKRKVSDHPGTLHAAVRDEARGGAASAAAAATKPRTPRDFDSNV